MSSLSFRFSLCLFAVVWVGIIVCAETVAIAKTENTETSPAEPWIKKAGAYEKKGELQRALSYLRIAAKIDPAHQEIDRKMTALVQKTEKAASRHFRKGVAYYQRRQVERAQKEFLVTLRYDPNHQRALDFLKNKLPQQRYSNYTVKKGDTFKKIAQKIYRDPQKDFLVARYNNLAPESKPVVGVVLKLPVLKEKLEKGDIDTRNELQKAKNFFNARKYEKVLPIVNRILKYDQSNEQANEMKNISYFQLGKKLHAQKEYTKSLRMYHRVDPEYTIVETAIAKVKKNMHAEAEDHYRKGVKHFVNDKFRAAILEWAKTLTLNPGHKKAKDDIEKARRILKKLETTGE